MSNNKSRIIVVTISYNLPSEVLKTAMRCHIQNKGVDFIYAVVDPGGFPLENWFNLPESVAEAKERNSESLKAMCSEYGMMYVPIKNKGVSGNWTQVYEHFKMQPDDIMLLLDSDEKTLNDNWIKALADVMASDRNMAWCSLLMHEQHGLMADMGNYPKELVDMAGYKVYKMWPGTAINWGMGAIRGSFIEKCGGAVPVYGEAALYGGIESACIAKIDEFKMFWGVLADYYEEHQHCPPLYGQWKEHVAFNVPQITFEQWLENKIRDKIALH
jgi:hypothetical protein